MKNDLPIKQKLLPASKYKIKAPYLMTPKFIVVHNTANDASAENEVNYMINNDNPTSFHYAIDDKEIIQIIPDTRNAWHAGDGNNGQGNRYGISIEICYSKSGGERFEKAEKLASKFIAYKLKEYGWGIEKVRKHQDFSGKYCPHRTLDLGWNRFLDMIKEELKKLEVNGLTEEDIRKIIQEEINIYFSKKANEQVSSWAKEAWEWGKKEKITDGSRPKSFASREEIITMLYRMKK